MKNRIKLGLAVVASVSVITSIGGTAFANTTSSSSPQSEMLFIGNNNGALHDFLVHAESSSKDIKAKQLSQMFSAVVSNTADSNSSLDPKTKFAVVSMSELTTKSNVTHRVNDLINRGITVYFYGPTINVDEVQNALGITIPFSEDAQQMHQIISYTKNGTTSSIVNVVDLGEAPGQTLPDSSYIESILNIESQMESTSNSISSSPGSKKNQVTLNAIESGTHVDQKLGNYLDTYDGGTYVGQQYEDLYLYDDGSDTTAHFWHVEDDYQVNVYNGYQDIQITVQHTVPGHPYTSQYIQGWGPDSSSTSGTLSVSLPIGVSYTFPTSGSYRVTTTGSLSSNNVQWVINPPSTSLSGTLPNQVNFDPATEWSTAVGGGVSGPYDAVIDTSHTVEWATSGGWLDFYSQPLQVNETHYF